MAVVGSLSTSMGNLLGNERASPADGHHYEAGKSKRGEFKWKRERVNANGGYIFPAGPFHFSFPGNKVSAPESWFPK